MGSGIWRVALSTGNSFGLETQWASGQGSGSPNSNLFVGDFNGDGLCDRATFQTSGNWWVATSIPQTPKTTAVWISTWYNTSDTVNTANFWNHTKRDSWKTPITGYGTTVTGIYNSTDHNVILRQLNAMKAVGIDLIVVDFTNGFYTDINAGTTDVRNGANAWFFVMDSLYKKNSLGNIKIALGLGYEFWCPRTRWGSPTDMQIKLLEQQKPAFDRVDTAYSSKYSNIYFTYSGKPLILIYIQDGTQLPLIDNTEKHYPLWHDKRFTLKNFVTWTSTWAYQPNNDDWQTFHNGKDNLYHGWGWGSLYGGTNNTTTNPIPGVPTNLPLITGPPLPYSSECMTIMPGSYIWYNRSWNFDVLRNNGNYYINSWKEVIKDSPRISMIADWNNWNEETAIEECTGWKDYYNAPQADWYLQITKAYSSIFKTGNIPDGTYVRFDENPSNFYLLSGSLALRQTALPSYKPIIAMPSGWYAKYTKLGKLAGDAKIGPFIFEVQQNYPNPFNPSTNISYSIPEISNVSIVVIDLLGREIQTLVNEEQQIGHHEITFDASKYSSGVYFYRIQAGNFVQIKKMVLMK